MEIVNLDMDCLLAMTGTGIQSLLGLHPILEVGGNQLPSTMPLARRGARTLKTELHYLGNPPRWCIYRYLDKIEPEGTPWLGLAVVDDRVIPKGDLRVEDIRHAFRGGVNYQKIVEAYNTQWY